MKFKTWRGQEVDIATAVEMSLSESEGGAVENAAATADNVARAFGRLVQILHERGHLSDDNVHVFSNLSEA
jgi:hypothetical protein